MNFCQGARAQHVTLSCLVLSRNTVKKCTSAVTMCGKAYSCICTLSLAFDHQNNRQSVKKKDETFGKQ
jgi:hypothetical protein